MFSPHVLRVRVWGERVRRPILTACAATLLGACTLGGPVFPRAADDGAAGVVLAAMPCAQSAPDVDDDGLSDPCELELARAFAPLLVVAPEGCNWDDGVAPARLGGEYYVGVQPVGGPGTARIVYLPAYYRDCGWQR